MRVSTMGLPPAGGDEPPIDFIRRVMRSGAARPIFQRLLDAIVERQRFAFNVGGHQTRGGEQWPDLAKSTIREKKRLGWPLIPLVRTTQLKLATQGRLLATETGMRLELFNETPYFKYHQQKAYRSSWLPRRRPIEVTQRDREFMHEQARAGFEAFFNRGQ